MTDTTPGTGRASGGKRPRRTFSPEYKHEAARLVIDTGRTIAEVARELGVGSQSLGTWVAAERATEAGEPTGELTGELTLDERAELKALRRQVAELHKDAAQGQRVPGKSSSLLREPCQRPANGTN